MIQVDARLYERYKKLRAKLCRGAGATTQARRECLDLHWSLFYTPQKPGQPISVPHPLDKP